MALSFKIGKDLKVSSYVEFLGVRQDIPRLLRSADLFWMTSRGEGFGLVIAEAFLSGVPVIATNVKGVRCLVKNRRTGLLVPSDDHSALAQATIRLWQDYSLQKSLSTTALKLATEEYDGKLMTERYLDIYAQVKSKGTKGMRQR